MQRRQYIIGAGSASLGGMLGLAGCMGQGGDGGQGSDGGDGGTNGDGGSGGDGGGGQTTLRMQTSGEGTNQYAMSQGVASVVNQASNEVRIDARPSDGSLANIRTLVEEDADLGTADSWAIGQAVDAADPFPSDFEFDLQSVVHWYATGGAYVTTNPDIESLSDITSDTPIWVGRRGSGYGQTALRLVNMAVGEGNYQLQSSSYGQEGSALSEGQIEVGILGIDNMEGIASWGQQIISTADVSVVDIPDGVVEELSDDPSVATAEFDFSGADGLGGPDTATVFNLPQTVLTHSGVSGDALHALLSTMWENVDQVSGTHALLKNFTEQEHWTTDLPTSVAPLHEGAKRFYDEAGFDY